MRRIVVKVGSNVLTRGNGKVDVTRLSSLADQIVWLRQHGYEVILVSSGAVACGRGELQPEHRLDSVEQRQLFSALGQVKLIGLYYDLMREHGVPVGQVLTTKESFATRDQYLNQRACMRVMLQNGVLPIVNENDTVSVTELMFTDNDELSGLIASMMDCDTLVLLTNVDGIYDGDPSAAETQLIKTVALGSDLSHYIKQSKSGFGRGGMTTKARIARKAAKEGIKVIIANGRRDDVLISLATQPDLTPHTEFEASTAPSSPMKKWIAHSEDFAKGCVHVNAQAAAALRGDQAASLLLVGVTQVEGTFAIGDIINVVDPEGKLIGVGRSNYGSETARFKVGMHDIKPLIHYDYLYIEE